MHAAQHDLGLRAQDMQARADSLAYQERRLPGAGKPATPCDEMDAIRKPTRFW
jgi:hypothetical protein